MSDPPPCATGAPSTSLEGPVEFATLTPAAIEPTLDACESGEADCKQGRHILESKTADQDMSQSMQEVHPTANNIVSTVADESGQGDADDGMGSGQDEETCEACDSSDGSIIPDSRSSPSRRSVHQPLFLPLEILGMIVARLPPSGVNSLIRLSSEHHRMLNPYLYESIRLVEDIQCRFLVRGVDNGVRKFTRKHDYFLRTKKLTLSFIPDADTCDILGTLVSLSHTPETPLMPNVAEIHFDEAFTAGIHRSFSRSHSRRTQGDPGFLCVMARPSSLRIDFGPLALQKCFTCTDDLVGRLSYRWTQPLTVTTRNTSFDAVYLRSHARLTEVCHILATPFVVLNEGSPLEQVEEECMFPYEGEEDIDVSADSMLDETRWTNEILDPHFSAIINNPRNACCERKLVFESLGDAEVSVLETAMLRRAKMCGAKAVKVTKVDGPNGTRIREESVQKVKFIAGRKV